MLIIHIFVALASLIFAGFTSFSPTIKKLRITYTLVIGTIGTGTYLIFTTPMHMINTCIEGLAYLFLVTAAIVYAKHKLSKVEE